LVRSVRRNGKVIQETVAQLDNLDAEGRVRAKALARQMTGRGEQRERFETVSASDTRASIQVDRVRVERGRSFGEVWLGSRYAPEVDSGSRVQTAPASKAAADPIAPTAQPTDPAGVFTTRPFATNPRSPIMHVGRKRKRDG
jgi:hypothetical protein